MKKRIFWRNPFGIGEGALCPFIGVTISCFEDFEKLLKERLFKPIEKGSNDGYYPPYMFSTKFPNIKVLFSGSKFTLIGAPTNPKNQKPYKWALFDERNGKATKFFAIQENWDEVFNLFDNDENVQHKIDILTEIVNREGGLTIHIGE